MRPLPRLLAFTDRRIAGFDDLGVRAAAIAAVGSAAGLVARWPDGSTHQLATLGQRLVSLAAPPMASVFVTGRADVAIAIAAHGVILRQDDLDVATVRQLLAGGERERRPQSRRRERTPPGLAVLRSVHSEPDAEAAVRDGADALIVGTIWPSPSHPGRPAAGTALLQRIVSFGVPVYAIGGVTPARAAEARALGSWGVAAISAVWDAAWPYRIAMDLVQPWMEAG